jgi:putative surface-exposed virulence protein
MNAAPALADDGLPPAEETPSAEEAAEDEAPPAEEVAGDEAPPAEEMTGETEPAAQEGEALPPAEETDPASEEQAPPVESILEGLPEDTQLIVVGEDGETLPLASQEAAEVLAAADPQWCPVGVVPGSAACSGVKDSFNGADPNTDLIAWLLANQPNKAGVIWVEAGYVGTVGIEGGAIVLDGDDYTSMDNYALTVNGGWTGTGMVMNPATPSTFNVPFAIVNWTGAVTLNNIVVTGASGGGVALEVATKGNITLTNVDVQNNTTDWGGAYLDNSSGAGNVIVNDSTFNGNTGALAIGLEINSKGIVTLKNVSAIGNSQEGAYIINSLAPTAKPVTLNGFNNFSLNGANGLTIYSRGAVTLSNITAIYNTGGSGAYVDNFGLSANVLVKGVNNFSNNGWDGLRVWSGGVITINSVTANDNGTDVNRPGQTVIYDAYGKGVFLYNAGALTPKGITITGTNNFNGNASTGLFVWASGAVKVNNITANDNGCDLAKENSPMCDGAEIRAGGAVTLTGYGTFLNNYDDGLEVHGLLVTLTNLTASGNGYWGAGVFGGTVNLLGANIFNDNQADGLYIQADGVVTLNNITATYNGGDGVYVDNTLAASSKAVMIKGGNIFNGNGGSGLRVYSVGAITTYNVTAMYNSNTGVVLDNCFWDGLNDCQAYLPQPVAMNGINNTSENGWDGLYIVSRGAIKVSSLTANYNGEGGAYLDNWFYNALGGILQTGYGTFLGNNNYHGLTAYSTGAVTLANLTASGNAGNGVLIWNDFNPAKPANVLISGFNKFNENLNSGLEIYSYGAVTLNNLTANENGDAGILEVGHGVYIYNAGGTLPRPVTINGVNTFNGNYGDGLYVNSLSAIRVSKVTASSNAESGAVLFNRYDFINAPITLVGYGIFNDNLNGDGLAAVSNGAILASNITANNNGFMGVYIDTYSVTAVPVTVTLLGVNTFNNNWIHGLTVYSDGQITLNNLTANGNGSWGAFLDNVTQGNPSAPRNILLNGTNTFIGNGIDGGGGGLFFFATGSAFLTRVTAALNTDGVADSNYSQGIEGYAFGNITLTCAALFFNEGIGYDLNAGGVVSLKGVFSYANGTPDSAIGSSVLITRTCPLP